MTDTRLPEYYLTAPALDGLSDAAFRCFINGLMWSVTHGTDGAVPVRAVRWLHPDATLTAAAVAELVACGLWAETGDGWSVRDFLKHQTTAADVEAGRQSERRKKSRQRKHARDDHSECTSDTCDVVRMSRGTYRPVPGVRLRTGQDRTHLREPATELRRARETATASHPSAARSR